MIGDKDRMLRTQRRGFSLGRGAEKISQMKKVLAPPRVRKMTKGTAYGKC